jgi:hypothetical protein
MEELQAELRAMFQDLSQQLMTSIHGQQQQQQEEPHVQDQPTKENIDGHTMGIHHGRPTFSSNYPGSILA